MFRQLKLRFFKTEALEAALDFLEQPRKNLDSVTVAEINVARIRIAKELIRRGVIFWD